MALAPGQKLHRGKYTVEQELGRGRFGITYLVRDCDGNGQVIKTLNDAVLSSPDFDRWQQNFVKEAFQLAKCRHPNIVRAEEPFQEGGLWCIPMEYIQGTNLELRRQSQLSEVEALRYIQQVGDALIEVHSHGLIHRDVKPANIMLRAGMPEAVLIDFGLAREFDHPLTVTRPEEIAKGFAPIELYLRTAAKGPYTDVYSLAATLYVLLTGKMPEDAKERKFSNAHLIPPKTLNPQIRDRTNRAILAGLEIEPKDRPQSIDDWLQLLDLEKSSSTCSKAIDPTLEKLPDWQKIGAMAGVVSVIVAVVLGVIGVIPGWMDMLKPDLHSPRNSTQIMPPQN